MRILLCNYEYPPLGGGGGVMTALLAEELAARHQVTVLTSGAFGLLADRVERGVRVVRVPVWGRSQRAVATFSSMLAYILRGVGVGKRLLDEAPYDVINTHFALPTGPVGQALALYGRIPNVLSIIGGDIYDPSKFFSPHRHPVLRAWVRSLLRRADAVVDDSDNIVEHARRFYVRDLKSVQIPLAIQRPPAGVGSRAAYGLRDDHVVLVTIGRLVARKAVHQLVELLPGLEGRVRLLVLGSGPQEAALKQLARDRGVEDRVRFLGHVDSPEKFHILRLSDAYVSTSQHEGFGLVFLEAMACGLPVVCYDCGGQTDFLEDGVTGALVPLNNVARFTERCRALVADPVLRARIGRANQKRVEQFFMDQCARRYEAVFEEAVARRRTDRPAPRGVAAPRTLPMSG